MTNNYDIVDKEGIFGQREVAENRMDICDRRFVSEYASFGAVL